MLARDVISRRLKAARYLAGNGSDKAIPLSAQALAELPVLKENRITKSRIEEIEQMRVDARPIELHTIATALGLPDDWFEKGETSGQPEFEEVVATVDRLAAEIRDHDTAMRDGITSREQVRNQSIVMVNERLTKLEKGQRDLLQHQVDLLDAVEGVRELLLGMRETAEALAVELALAQTERAIQESAQPRTEVRDTASTRRKPAANG